MKEKSQYTAKYKVGGRLAARSNQLPGKFPLLVQNHPFARYLRSSHRHDFTTIRIYYRKMRFIKYFARFLSAQFCSTHGTKPSEIYVRLAR